MGKSEQIDDGCSHIWEWKTVDMFGVKTLMGSCTICGCTHPASREKMKNM